MRHLVSIFVATACLAIAHPVAALPGQRTSTVAAWILGNPTLQAAFGEDLVVQRRAGDEEFRFEASIFPPGRIRRTRPFGGCNTPISAGRIRAEQFWLKDFTNTVPRDRLELGLRAIYGLNIYVDYNDAALVYQYPTPQMIEQARRLARPALEGNRGEIRMGDRYAYWLERAVLEDGTAPSGHMTVLLKEDVPKLVQELGGGDIATLDCPSP